jgi:8-oxo-dGTP pyrophosphatase MutT (NUDIX family)
VDAEWTEPQSLVQTYQHSDTTIESRLAISKSIRRQTPRVQNAALPYRTTESGAVEVLLVTTLDTKRWIIPKGWPMKGRTAAVSAAREAFEESGLRGAISPQPFGTYTYDKGVPSQDAPLRLTVEVFPLLVRKQSKTWPERAKRKTRWFPIAEAIAAVDEPSLKELLGAFSSSRSQ